MDFFIGFNVSFAVIFIDLSVFIHLFSLSPHFLSCKVCDLFFLIEERYKQQKNSLSSFSFSV